MKRAANRRDPWLGVRRSRLPACAAVSLALRDQTSSETLMAHHPAHIPDGDRHLPADLYGTFDIQPTPDGGKRYSLPHTLGNSVLAYVTQSRMLASIAAVALLCPLIAPENNAGSPLSIYWLYAPLMFFLLHGLCALAVLTALLVSGRRKVTRITIRADGLILDDVSFYPAEHIWGIGYGTTINEGQSGETFVPRITIQVGTNPIILADGIEVEAGRLFMRLYSDDARRYWSRHN